MEIVYRLESNVCFCILLAAFMSVLHMYETFGWWRRADYLKVHFAESWNEMHHLLIMEVRTNFPFCTSCILLTRIVSKSKRMILITGIGWKLLVV